jgi:hypothetical protein
MATTYRTAEYTHYLNSEAWKARRAQILARDGYMCRRCHGIAREVHHLTYERLGRERDDDLESLCSACHVVADKERAEQAAADAEDARYQARLNGWATKRYGEDWDDYHDIVAVEEQFDDWLASRDDW